MSRFTRVGRWPITAAIAVLTALAVAMLTMSAGTSSAAGGGNEMSGVVAKSKSGMMKAPVTGTTEDGRKLKGSFTPTSFDVVGETLMVTGDLEGKIIGHGKPMAFDEEITTAVEDATVAGKGVGGPGSPGAAAAACDILNLVLGPLDLDLLGLQVHLDQIVLDIVAQSGAGNLLGNLLCAVAGLLDGAGGLGGVLGGLLTQLQGLLTQILGVLNL
ncbi:MAG TPA: hypothetical protein VFJ28_13730 [Marmoricola sp.]|nr:hypothetical protein [Marmoricola sp.]